MWTARGFLRAFLAVAVALGFQVSSVAGDDCNRNGVDDALDIEARTSRDCNGNGIPDECDLAPTHLAFEPPLRFRLPPTEGLWEGVVIGSFNGDGKPDILTKSDKPSILLSTGDGKWSEPRTVIPNVALGLAAADLNGDGKLDLAAGGLNNGWVVRVFLGNGDGTFSIDRTTSFSGNGGSIVAADLDRDADIDLLVFPRQSDGITLFRNNGQGAFAVQSLQRTSTSMKMFLVTGDFDGDVDVDFLVPAGPGWAGLLLFRNRGDATFDAEPQRDDMTFNWPPMVGDLDGDGDLDIFSTLGDLFLNLGNGTFDARLPTELSVDWRFSSRSGVAADMDRDGDLDLVLAGILIGRNRGDGTFPTPETIRAGTSPHPLAAADLNGDGVPDIVANDQGRLLVLLGRTATAPASPDVNKNQTPDECEQDCDRDGVPDAHAVAVGKVRDCNLNGVPDGCDVQAKVHFEMDECAAVAGDSIMSRAVADLDGNGNLDVALLREVAGDANPAPNIFETDSRLEVYLNAGNGILVATQELDFDRPPYFLAAGDFDGDGWPDLFGTQGLDGRVLVLLNDRSGSFSLAGRFPAGQHPWKAYALDLDGDDRLDLLVESADVNGVVTATILINRGGKTFSPPKTFRISGWVLALADLDANGAPDLLTYGPGGFVIVTWNDGRGFLRDSRKLLEGSLLAAADFDGDRDIDLAVDNYFEWERFVLLNLGDGNFERGADLTRDIGGFIVFDADGDRDVDLVGTTAGPQGRRLAVVPGNGRGAFGPLLVSEGTPLLGGPFRPGDFDKDGLSDLAVLGGGGGCLFSTFLNRTTPAKSKDQNSDGIPDECGAPSGGQLPLDATQDGTLDISDAVWVLGRIFRSAASPWPCDGGWNADPGPADVHLLDSTGDGALDLSDPIALLGYLFLPGSPPPTLGTRCVVLPGCPDRCAP